MNKIDCFVSLAMTIPIYFFKLLIIGLILLLAACGSPPQKKSSQSFFSKAFTAQEIAEEEKKDEGDGPPDEDIDVTHIPNAIPKLEPLSRYGNMPVYEVWGSRYRVMSNSKGYKAQGTASWYGKKFHGQRTSSGEKYDMYAMTAAHRSLPLPTYAKVKNLKNGKEVIVKINDRGPFVHNRLIDLSYAAAKKLGIHSTGTAKVQITAIDPAQWHKENKARELKLANVANAKKGKGKSTAKEQTLAKNSKSTTSKSTQLAKAEPASKPKTKNTATAKAKAQSQSTTVAKTKTRSKPTTVAKAETGSKSTVAKAKTTSKSTTVAKAKAGSKPTTVAKANAEKKIFIQLATFSQKENADKLAEKATTLTQIAANVKVSSSNSTDQSSYKVRIGPLKNETQAAELKKKLVALNGATPKLIYE